jgi:hypothetical protein
MSETRYTRRRLLQTIGVGSAGFALRDVLFPLTAKAQSCASTPPRLLVFCYFSGGWDQLCGLDPRPFQQSSPGNCNFPNSNSPINPAFDQIVDISTDVDSAGNKYCIANYLNSAAGKTNYGLIQPIAGNSSVLLGPSFYDTVFDSNSPNYQKDVFQSCCVIRGINMGTLTHEVGRRYFITGKFPAGLTAQGSALPTWWAYQNGDATGSPIPNISMGVETYNSGLPSFASGMETFTTADLLNTLRPLPPSIASPSSALAGENAAVHQYESSDDCWETQLNGQGLVDMLRAGRLSALNMVAANLGSYFTFPNPGSSGAGQNPWPNLYNAFGIKTPADLAGPKGQALLAAQALTPVKIGSQMASVATCVSIQPAIGIDSHDSEWTKIHPAYLREGFDAVGRLISYLQNTPDPCVSGKMLIDRTQIMCFSEFARTPYINARGGRDHHLSSSCMLAGAGIRGGTVIGATSDSDFLALPIDLNTGKVAIPTGELKTCALPATESCTGTDATPSGGYTVRPPDIHATFLQAAGFSDSNLFNQQPVIIPAILQSC